VEIKRNVSLAAYTTFKVGGLADFFAIPETQEELEKAIGFAEKNSLEITILGRGSNVLVSDKGIRGLTIVLRKFENSVSMIPLADGKTELAAGTGVSLPRLSREVANAGFTGYEFYIGIPGTVGGAILMNAGYGPGNLLDTAHRCLKVRYWKENEGFLEAAYSDFNPTYRRTEFHRMQENGERFIITGATFALNEKADREEIRKETAKHLMMRKEKQPLTKPTAGSVFRASEDGTPAAVWIDRAGLKGLRIGGACISEKHANWIENIDNSTAEDILELINVVSNKVKEHHGVDIHPELCLLGEF
jgi:UDP-N-acetylmuramate dehydrogenase